MYVHTLQWQWLCDPLRGKTRRSFGRPYIDMIGSFLYRHFPGNLHNLKNMFPAGWRNITLHNHLWVSERSKYKFVCIIECINAVTNGQINNHSSPEMTTLMTNVLQRLSEATNCRLENQYIHTLSFWIHFPATHKLKYSIVVCSTSRLPTQATAVSVTTRPSSEKTATRSQCSPWQGYL